MKLYLQRHGEAKSAQQDPQRGLTPHGQQQIKNVAAAMKKTGADPKLVYHSGKRRAEETAQISCGILAPSLTIRQLDGMKPNDPPEALLPMLESMQQDTLLVSHLPFLPTLTGLLVTNLGQHAYLEFGTGTVVCLQSDDNQQWMISWILSPELKKT